MNSNTSKRNENILLRNKFKYSFWKISSNSQSYFDNWADVRETAILIKLFMEHKTQQGCGIIYTQNKLLKSIKSLK